VGRGFGRGGVVGLRGGLGCVLLLLLLRGRLGERLLCVSLSRLSEVCPLEVVFCNCASPASKRDKADESGLT
jgi:hypothetical protein